MNSSFSGEKGEQPYIVVRATGIGKGFGSLQALKDISFEVSEGEIFGFIGPDGAGKTTLFRIITTLLLPDAGVITILGADAVTGYRKLRNHIGYMPGRFSLYMDLTVEENLQFYASVFGVSVKENYPLIRDIYSHIEPFKRRRAGQLSGGMKQKLALSCALIHRPRLLVLDEPTTGVDAVSRIEFWELLGQLREHRITVIVSTPYMDEAMRCDRVALMQEGRILISGTPGQIVKGFSRRLVSIRSSQKVRLITALRSFPGILTVWPFGEDLHVTFREEVPDPVLHEYLLGRGIDDATITVISAGIEDRFLELSEQEQRGGDSSFDTSGSEP